MRMFAYGLVPLENYMALEGWASRASRRGPVFISVGRQKSIPFRRPSQSEAAPVVMTFGTNNASGQFTRESFIDAYRDAIAAIQDAYPYCDVIINAIPPIGKVRSYPDITMETLDDFNKALEELAQELGLPFLNSSEAPGWRRRLRKAGLCDRRWLHLSSRRRWKSCCSIRTHAYEAEDRRPVAVKAPERKGSACPAGRCGSIRRRAGELTGCFQKKTEEFL